MALTISKLIRTFEFSGVRLPDPNPGMPVDDVKAFYAATYPELATAVVNGPETRRRQDALHVRPSYREQRVIRRAVSWSRTQIESRGSWKHSRSANTNANRLR